MNNTAREYPRTTRTYIWLRLALASAMGIGLLLAPKPARSQGTQRAPLSLSQLERLVQIHAPDATIGGEIRKRGLSFSPDKATAESLQRLGAGPETLQAIDELRPMLEDAKQAIPASLTRIYQLLDEGNSQALRPLVSADIVNQTNQLDQICRPFTYRTHYIQSIVERPVSAPV